MESSRFKVLAVERHCKIIIRCYNVTLLHLKGSQAKQAITLKVFKSRTEQNKTAVIKQCPKVVSNEVKQI